MPFASSLKSNYAYNRIKGFIGSPSVTGAMSRASRYMGLGGLRGMGRSLMRGNFRQAGRRGMSWLDARNMKGRAFGPSMARIGATGALGAWGLGGFGD